MIIHSTVAMGIFCSFPAMSRLYYGLRFESLSSSSSGSAALKDLIKVWNYGATFRRSIERSKLVAKPKDHENQRKSEARQSLVLPLQPRQVLDNARCKRR
jgi:hypothetical protein